MSSDKQGGAASGMRTIPVKELLRICPNCGERGPHLVPPSMGDPKFYICVANPERVTEARAELEAKYAAPVSPVLKGETR